MKTLLALFFSLIALLAVAQAAADDSTVTEEAIRHALLATPVPKTSPESKRKDDVVHRLEKFEAHTRADVVVGAGAAVEISIPTSAQIRISNSTILSAEDLGSHLRLVGKKIGEAQVHAGAKTWNVSVLSPSAWSSYQQLLTHLKTVRGLQARVRGGHVRIEGRLLRGADWRDLAAIEDLDYRFGADIEPDLAQTLRADIQKELTTAQLPSPSFSLTPEAKVFLTQEQAPLAPAYERALQRWGFAVEVNPTLVTLAPLVRIKILVAEVDKSFAQTLGVNWKQALSAQLLPAWVGVKQASSVSVSLDALETSGLSHILASPNLLCRSGKEAEFLAGGEFPIKITNFAAQDVTWKQYGVLLKVSPVADSLGHMSIAIKTEISDIDEKHTVEGIPGMITNRIQSHFDLSRPQTIALSGLIKKKSSESRDGLPFLSRIPVLGQLFSSQAFNHDETELIIFVTPEVVHPEEGSAI